MAGVEERVEDQVDPSQVSGTAAPGSDEIVVENPATGREIGRVPDLSAEAVAELARKGRAAQPGWQALGFEGRAKILLRAQKWIVDHRERVIQTIVDETGKTYEDALIAEFTDVAAGFGFWAKNAPKLLADEKVRTASPFVLGRKRKAQAACRGRHELKQTRRAGRAGRRRRNAPLWRGTPHRSGGTAPGRPPSRRPQPADPSEGRSSVVARWRSRWRWPLIPTWTGRSRSGTWRSCCRSSLRSPSRRPMSVRPRCRARWKIRSRTKSSHFFPL